MRPQRNRDKMSSDGVGGGSHTQQPVTHAYFIGEHIIVLKTFCTNSSSINDNHIRGERRLQQTPLLINHLLMSINLLLTH